MNNLINLNSVQARELIEKNKDNEKFMIIDVRTQDEYDLRKIDGAILFNIMDVNFQDKISKLDRSGVYLIYCASGNRSLMAINVMKSLGFNELYNLKFGINSW